MNHITLAQRTTFICHIADSGKVDYLNKDYPNSDKLQEAADAIEALQAQLNQQVALVEKCIVEMNRNADLGQKAEAERDTAMQHWGAVNTELKHLITERDAALAELAKLRDQAPFAYYNEGIGYHTKGDLFFHKKPTQNLETRWWADDTPLYAGPRPAAAPNAIEVVAQLKQVRAEALEEAFTAVSTLVAPADEDNFEAGCMYAMDAIKNLKEGL